MSRLFTLCMFLVFILALSLSVCCVGEVSPDIINPYPVQEGDNMTDKVVKTD